MRTSFSALTFATIAGICFAAGSLSIIDAADGWQQVLYTVRAWRGTRSGPTCPDQWTIAGWGDEAVLVLGGIGVVLIAVTLVGSVAGRRWLGSGKVTALAALVPGLLLLVDAYAVGGSSIGDCDGIGVSGAAGAALTRAGWLLAGSMVLCFLAYAALWTRDAQPWEG
jgi:hypothetical protein